MTRTLVPLAVLLALGWQAVAEPGRAPSPAAAGLARGDAPRAKEPDLGPASRRLGDGAWRKGNTHTHTLWSDGNGAPEWVAKWYREHGYQFLVLSDHNVLSVLTKYFPIEDAGRLTPARVEQLKEAFGAEWVRERVYQGRREMKLKTLDELRAHFERPGEFLFVQGEEITDTFGAHPVHVNALNLDATIPPQKGETVVEVLRRNLQAVEEYAERSGRPILAHLNHPNFGWGVSAEDLASVEEGKFFEVYNGHPGVRNYGDAEHLSTEAIWDHVLTRRLRDLGFGIVYGVASDDAHEYFLDSLDKSNTGAGWVMVSCDRLEGDALVEAMHRGDFYATSGVRLRRIEHDARGMSIEVDAQDGVDYRVEFVGTRWGEGQETGVLFASSEGSRARYEFAGDEIYVRAKVVSTRAHPRPFAEGDLECAWIQPVALPRER